MKKRILASCILALLTACHSSKTEEALVLIQIQDRNGLSETISTEERLATFTRQNFLAAQPYKKVLRIYRVDGKNYSVLTSYHDNGVPHQFLQAQEMRANGLYKEWFANGVQRIEAQVIGGIADLTHAAQESWLFEGEALVWNEDGSRAASILYEKGVLCGPSTYYYPTGAIERQIPYKQGKTEGEVQEFWEDGQKKITSTYHTGIKEGISRTFWPQGALSSEEDYEQGLLKQGLYWNPSQELIAQVEEGKGTKALFSRTAVYETQEIRKGIPEGRIQTFYLSGELRATYVYKNGQKHGEELIYFTRDETEEKKSLPKISLTWDQDSLHGIVKTWYPNGQLQSQRELCRNIRSGPACGWYLDGSLMFLEEYEEGKLMRGQYFRKKQNTPVSTITAGNGFATIFDEHGIFMRKIQYAKSKPVDPEF